VAPPKRRYNTRSISPRESIKEVVDASRKLLYTQLSIDAKEEERMRMKEY